MKYHILLSNEEHWQAHSMLDIEQLFSRARNTGFMAFDTLLVKLDDIVTVHLVEEETE